MQPTENRGWGAAAGRLADRRPAIPRYGISPQLAPATLTAADKACFADPCVTSPQVCTDSGSAPMPAAKNSRKM